MTYRITAKSRKEVLDTAARPSRVQAEIREIVRIRMREGICIDSLGKTTAAIKAIRANRDFCMPEVFGHAGGRSL